MAKCVGLRALHMPRSKNAFGPFFQPFGPSCIKGMGNYYGPGMPGDGARAISGVTESEFTILITFSQCVNISGPQYATLWRESTGSSTTLTAVEKVSDTVWRYTTNVALTPGDTLKWSYEAGFGVITDCKEGEDLEDQTVSVSNTLVLGGHLILLESGGMDIILVEEDTADTDGIILEEAA